MSSLGFKKKVGLVGSLAAVAAGLYLARTDRDNPLVGQAVGGGDVHAIEPYVVTDVDHNWQSLGLSDQALANGAVFAQAVTVKGADPGLIRLDGDQIRYQESDNGNHDYGEVAHAIALVGDPLQLGINGEVGTINPSVTGHGMRVTINFQRSYTNPVLFLQVNSNLGSDPISVYGTTVSSTWAYVKFFEPGFKDGTHYGETIHWAVIEAGTYDLPDGQRLVVGKQAVATDSASDFDSISLKGQFLGPAAVVTGIQHLNNHVYAGTRVKQVKGADGTLIGIETRLMRQTGADGTAISGTIGYMALGAPFNLQAGRMQLTLPSGTIGLNYAQHPNGHCYNLSDDDSVGTGGTLEFHADNVRTSVVAYADPYCSNQVGAATATNTTGTLDFGNNKVSSVRVLWAREARLYADANTCVSQGEVLLQNELGWLIFQTDGNLVLYRYNPADGSIWKAWATDTSLDANALYAQACFESSGELLVRQKAFIGGTTVVWRSNSTAAADGTLRLQNDCNLVIYGASNGAQWSTNTHDCYTNVPAADPQGMPEITFTHGDVDGDGDKELTLMVTKDDGSGYIVLDPLGIADYTHNNLGYDITDDFWESLSATQKAVLLAQVAAIKNVGDSVSGQEMEEIAEQVDGADDRTYRAFAFTGKLSSTAVDTEDSLWGANWQTRSSGERFYGTVKFGETAVTMDLNDGWPSLEVGLTAAEATIGVGGVASVGVEVGSVGAALDVERNSTTIGASADAIKYTATVGNENASYASLSAGAGTGFWLDLKTGKNDQYGATVEVPFIPVGVAVYVKGSDAVDAYEWCAALSVNTANATADIAADAWTSAKSLALSTSDDIVIAVENAASQVTVAYARVEDTAVVIVADTGDYAMTILDATSDAITTALNAVESGLDAATNAVSEAFDTVTNTFDNAISSVGDAVQDAWSEATDVAEDVADATKDVVNDVSKKVCKLFGC